MTRRKVKLLEGICPEAEDLLNDKPCPMAVFDIMRRMVPLRQIEAAEFMVNANNYTVNYASAILAGRIERFVVGRRLKEDFDNGKHYYDLHGTAIRLPHLPSTAPSADALEWHREHRFLG